MFNNRKYRQDEALLNNITQRLDLYLQYSKIMQINHPVEQAAKDGHLDDIKKFIENGGDVNTNFNSSRKYTLMHYAAQCGHQHIAEYLLKCKGINLMARDCDLSTPLHIAALYSNPEIVKMLCEATQNNGVNSQTSYGSTPIHLAIDATHDPDLIKRSNAVIDYLLSIPETTILMYTELKETPLTLAKQYRRYDLMEKLVKAATIQLGISLVALSASDFEQKKY